MVTCDLSSVEHPASATCEHSQAAAALHLLNDAMGALASLRIDLDPRFGGHGTPEDLWHLWAIHSALFDVRTKLGVRR